MTPERFAPQSGLRLRVYTLDGDGEITSDTGTMHLEGARDREPSTNTAFPPCGCRDCRERGAR
ncbi:hypothetical protein SALBM135S_05803 [Streptomyces alboniger]